MVDRPGPDASRALIYFHGGGYCSGSIRPTAAGGRGWPGRMRALGVAYRLAPEHPFPAARDDALTVSRACAAKAMRPNTSRSAATARRDLTLALVKELRRAARTCPAVSGSCRPRSISPCRARRSQAKARSIRSFRKGTSRNWPSFRPAGNGPQRTRLSPLYADLKGLPPILIQSVRPRPCSTMRRLASPDGAADVSTTLEIWPQMSTLRRSGTRVSSLAAHARACRRVPAPEPVSAAGLGKLACRSRAIRAGGSEGNGARKPGGRLDQRIERRPDDGLERTALSAARRFRFMVILIATSVSSVGLAMFDAGSAWLMTSLDPSPRLVSAVQVATTLPLFLLTLPAGALSDLVDPRQLLIVAEAIVTVIR